MAKLPMHYQTSYVWQGQKADGAISIGGHDVLPVGTPHDADRYSPEHLLLIAAETCLANYVLLIASMSGLEVKAYRSSAEAELERDSSGLFRFKQIMIRPQLTVDAASETAANRVLDKAHRSCLVARSLDCEVGMEATVITA